MKMDKFMCFCLVVFVLCVLTVSGICIYQQRYEETYYDVNNEQSYTVMHHTRFVKWLNNNSHTVFVESVTESYSYDWGDVIIVIWTERDNDE